MIQDLKDLKALFKMCRAQGITEIKLQGVEIKFGELPYSTEKPSNVSVEEQTELSDEDLLYYSSPSGQQEIDKMVGLKESVG